MFFYPAFIIAPHGKWGISRPCLAFSARREHAQHGLRKRKRRPDPSDRLTGVQAKDYFLIFSITESNPLLIFEVRDLSFFAAGQR